VHKRVDVSAHLDHPIERVFDYLADPTKWHEFAPAVVLRRQIGSDRPRVGTRWAAVDRIGPFKIRFTDELAEFQAHRCVAFRSSAPWNATTEYCCEPLPAGGTRVKATYEGDVDGWLRILSLAPAAVIGMVLRRDLIRLQARLNNLSGA